MDHESITTSSPECTSSIDRLLFALYACAVADIRRVFEVHQRSKVIQTETLRAKFSAWERGQISGSAAFLLHHKGLMEVPETAMNLARKIIQVEQTCGQIEELLAASLAGSPWALPNICLRCGGPGSWRQVQKPNPGAAPEVSWRFGRPENHIPLCYRCAYRIKWSHTIVQIDLAYGVWGVRFEAFERWRKDWISDRLPNDWDKRAYPLWPASFGGQEWETGSGGLDFVVPQPPTHVLRKPEHILQLAKWLRVPKKRVRSGAEDPVLLRLNSCYLPGNSPLPDTGSIPSRLEPAVQLAC